MMVKSSSFFFLLILSSLLLLFLQAPATVDAVTCDPTQLIPCASAIIGSAPPSATCCARLKAQQPCFCQYEKNRSLRGYINSPNSRTVAKICAVTFPSC
ncbi:putative non-specific lipid-transfer protein AKCS9 [Ananas comosus]|uniref:Putative non-specific lipid-transfer protein AKCS9 n=1 Tax=Ananas comosus TaxID=4615 RepID=A0A199UTU5_ANACO|nr:putative non-specific lipid-transfer protein AKCS9 [Ananas comosus]